MTVTSNLGIIVLQQVADLFKEYAQSKENAMASPFDSSRLDVVSSSLTSNSSEPRDALSFEPAAPLGLLPLRARLLAQVEDPEVVRLWVACP